MYKYNIADRNHPIQEVDIQEENLASIFFSVESLQVEYNRISIKKERITNGSKRIGTLNLTNS